MYLVIECCDREISAVKPARDAAESVALANQMLEEHLETIGYDKNEPDGDDLQRADPSAGESTAWCNLKNMHFDAFRFELKPGDARAALDMLAKDFCKATMDAPGSECGIDGSCGDCPVTALLDMMSGSED